jgi:hypothetical protein
VFAGAITMANPGELVPGPAATGMVGDFYIRNAGATFIISAPTRVIGVIPQGGNLIDAVLLEGGVPVVEDHFGELGMLYKVGRTCDHERVEIVRDGSGGGIAALRAIGHAATDDFINLKAVTPGLTVEGDVDPDVDDGVECATTYVLAPGSTTLETYFTLYNPTTADIQAPFGTIADTGGETEGWGNLRGFERLSLSLDALTEAAPLDYTVYQGPGVAYGVVPREPVPMTASAYLIAGVSIFVFGTDELLQILDGDLGYLTLPGKDGYLQRVDLVLGRDGEDVDAIYRAGLGETLRTIDGTVTVGGTPGAARVGVFQDVAGDGVLDDTDPVISYMDVAADGTYSGQVPQGNLLVRAEVKNEGRSAAMPAGTGVALPVTPPVRLDFEILDDATGMPMPGRLLVIGDHPAFPDHRLFETYDRVPGVVTQLHAIRGSSTLGADPDPALYLPAGGDYRIYASRGTEWSVGSVGFTANADGEISIRLRQVAPATGYLSTEWHVHQVGSPDSPVGSDERVRSALSAGIELFPVTDHDFVADLQPIVEQLGLTDLVRIIPGIEVTPFAYGHFNAWPMNRDALSPNGGAVDWARGMVGYAMTPGEIFDAMRTRGAQLVQINHPRRTSAFSELQAYFDRANLTYDYTARTIFGDFEGADVPYTNDMLRLPGMSLWSDAFDVLEIWNGFSTDDTDVDGTRELFRLDKVLADWFNMLSLGLVVTPAGNSDTHTSVLEPMGMPRTYVRVPDDSSAAIASGAVVDDARATMSGTAQRDVVVTDGPMLEVRSGTASAIGATVAATGGSVTLTVSGYSPDWAEIDTLEVFANATPDIDIRTQDTALVPMKCWTNRPLASLDPADPCLAATLPPEAMTIALQTLPGGGNFRRYQFTVTVTIDAMDIVNRAGATGQDAWLVFRVRGDRGIFPIMADDSIDATTLPVLLAGDMDQIAQALVGRGFPAQAFTAPIFVDFDGGGYRAPFAP